MDPLGISWLVTSSCSPLVAVLALWTIYVFHTYRRRWRTVDLFLLTIISQELVISIFTFCYAIISLINPPFKTPCQFTQWGLTATRTFQVATLASMVVDRSLTVRWPYRYRFSVRRNQIRYHIGVLVLVSVLVGVAAVFARSAKDSKHCYLHPMQWDIKYIVFILSLYGVLMVISFICMIQVEIYRSKHGAKLSANGSFQLPECASPELPSATGMNSPLDTQSSTGSTRALHRPSRQASRRPYGKNNKGTSDLRWPSVALTCLLCFSVNHIPNLVLLSLATWSSSLWSPWHEAILSWLGLVEGVFVPLLLFLKDSHLRMALRRTFQRRSGALSPLVGDDGPFQMYFDKDHFRKRGTFGSVTPVGIITNYRRTPGKKRRCKKSGSGAKYTLPGLHSGDSVLAKSCFGAGFLGGEPLSKLSCADLTSLEMWREEEEENFYATLSDDFSTFSCKSADDSALSEDIREELYGGSFTTIANDDFEFHDTRPCGGEVKMRPALSVTPPPTQKFNIGVSRNVSFRESLLKRESKQNILSEHKNNELFDFVTSPDEDDQKDPSAFILPATDWKYTKIENDSSSPSDLSSCNTSNNTPNKNKLGTMGRQKKATSFSMNDLDLIKKRGSNRGENAIILPVKSESTMSLYRLNVERDLDQMAMTPSKSENNVNGDSGFGSGAQSTNPVWSGFLCRKPSDPFWNIRKPTVTASPTSNYSAILHPRMRKIPWISAWKKLDSNNDSSKTEVQNSDKIVWTDPAVYGVKKELQQNTPDNQVSTIEEELSDVGTPIFHEDYNLNIFAKESGVLLENAYGRIERDDCGVKVNFYGENVQYDAKGNASEHSQPPESSVDSGKPVFSSRRLSFDSYPDSFRIENHIYEPLNVKRNSDVVLLNTDADCTSENKPQDVNDGDTHKCELQLNGDYENMFGTKENIFAQRDQYKSKAEADARNSNVDGNLGHRRDSERLKNLNYASVNPETSSSYGQLRKPERKESFNRKSREVKELQNNDVIRRASDGKNRKCGIRRKGSKTRNDRRPEVGRFKAEFENSNFQEFGGRETSADDKNRNQVEFEMMNVPGRNDLNCNVKPSRLDGYRINVNRRDSQSKKSSNQDDSNAKMENQNRPEYIEIRDERGIKIIRRESFPKDCSRDRKLYLDCDNMYAEPRDILWRSRVERRDSNRQVGAERSDSGKRVSVERSNSSRRVSAERYESPRKQGSRRVSVERAESFRHINAQRRDSGRGSNIPRLESNVRCTNGQGAENDRCSKLERRESSKMPKTERRDSTKTRRDSNCQADTRDSDICLRRDGVQRGDSQSKKLGEVKNEGLWVNAIPFDTNEENGNTPPKRESRKEAYDLHRSPRKSNIARRESRNRNGDPVKRKVSDSRTPQKEQTCPENKIQRKWPKPDGHLDDFLKYRDKCEDNFSHIQNINRETSAEREQAKVEQLRLYGKLNGNVTQNGEPLPFQDQKRPLFQSSKPCDINDNCGQKKLAITDFL